MSSLGGLGRFAGLEAAVNYEPFQGHQFRSINIPRRAKNTGTFPEESWTHYRSHSNKQTIFITSR